MGVLGMTASRHVGRLGQALAPPTLSFRGALPLRRRPWVCTACSRATSRSVSSEAEDSERTKRPFTRLPELFKVRESFAQRHIGPDDESTAQMLAALSPPCSNLDEFVAQVIPPDILSKREMFSWRRQGFSDANKTAVFEGHQEHEVFKLGSMLGQKDKYALVQKTLMGGGYYGTHVPEVIKRNVLESPAWYTSYTPYQPEISQGRLESLLNFQTMVSDLTALPVANASLLDEGTAAAEAMTMSINAAPASRVGKGGRKVFVISGLFPQTRGVLFSRAEGLGVEIVEMTARVPELIEQLKGLGNALVGVMVQYPDQYGLARDYKALVDFVHGEGLLLSAATDLLALTLLTPPGEWGADIAFGNSQRFGVPLGNGGPHAAFFAVAEKHKRKMPGRLVGVSKDRLGGRALRLALQTREQHIRREKATSNVCTAQALLANMSAMYAVYHGPEGLKAIAERCFKAAQVLRLAANHYGLEVHQESGATNFDTVSFRLQNPELNGSIALRLAAERGYRLRWVSQRMFSVSVDETVVENDLQGLLSLIRELAEINNRITNAQTPPPVRLEDLLRTVSSTEVQVHRRESKYLTHPVFNTHHSETELLRYIHHLQSKDLSLVHSMIPLGSCTMKLNGSTEMALITLPGFSDIHPHIRASTKGGYANLIRVLEDQLMRITGMDGVSLQPNSGAQGEFAGLRAIRNYHKATGQTDRDICLIPVSAHGTNPASAAMAGMRVVPIKCDPKTGNLDLKDLEAKCEQYSDKVGAMMITYPSTFGVFEPKIKEVCNMVHLYGGQVYMDGANMNAQIGLCSPGEIGADVCHLNLHKTFCIPHGGGGPGVGPICVKEHLIPHLPTIHTMLQISDNPPVSSAPYGSAGILPISWAYNVLMGNDGLKKATQIGLLNANYLLSRLQPHYQILYTNEHGRCAHEFILDVRPFSKTAGVEAIDIAKRLQDYGFHAPTMSWPVPNTLMIEPTESESKEELDRFVDALVSIREEIREIEEGKMPREGNVLKMAPHPLVDIIEGDGEDGAKWDRPYTRQKAAYPLPWLKEKKFWPSVARVNDTYGDLNLFCTCPPVEDTTGGNMSSVQED
ncbi:glycine cleavage system P-protein-domain-containing protein [Apodospora peruviana]|uniref:Glycine cleavage system P protein n=1 Tax=Apodospora peruviana TaxID=516989 RepID=A0AAE0IU09_9PEZI|nr:glycine cleavage system P-protein-domain-containing protein [Apodospora peruviana]